MQDNKKQLLAWAYTVIKEQVEKGLHGKIEVHMNSGNVGLVRVEENFKPPSK